MKLQDLTIDQFQRIAALEFSPVLTDYDKRAGVVKAVGEFFGGRHGVVPGTQQWYFQK